MLALSTSKGRNAIDKHRIWLNRIVRFIRIGCLLHLIALAGALVLWVSLDMILATPVEDVSSFPPFLYIFTAIYGTFLPIFAELDVLSRYQNYKKAKDLFHENGFHPRIARLFIHSRCQRDAVGVAARDLGLKDELGRYYHMLGYRWYHILPDFVFKRPVIFFSWRYWQKTLFESRYRLKHFWW